MKNLLKAIARKVPPLQRLLAQRDALLIDLEQSRANAQALETQKDHLEEQRNHLQAESKHLKKTQGFVPPGHFYSPVPDFAAVKSEAERIFGQVQDTVPGLDFRTQEQLDLLHAFAPYYTQLPFTAEKQSGLRYHYDNPAYSWTDAIFLHCMIRHVQPRRIVEVGSGFSSCMTLDTNELHFAGSIQTTFIEPYPELLLSLLKKEDERKITILPSRLQDVDLSVFDTLQANDILFIDSTHVSKIDSDVNRILFEILPRLASGVYIHFHDIFYPFEYPDVWVYEGRAWNEAYILKAFLQFNPAFQIELMSTFLARYHYDVLEEHLPLCLNNTGGNIWLRRI